MFSPHLSVMELRLFILLFFTGVLPLVLSVPRKYYGVNQGKTWSDAQTYCRANHIDLATFENDAEVVKVQNEAQKQQFTAAAWIGLYKIYHDWRWSYGNILLEIWTGWCPGEPTNDYGCGECVCVDSWGWFDAQCTLKLPFVCFDDRLTGNSRYIYYSNVTTWHHAQIFCKKNHVDLANTLNLTELSVVQPMISGLTWIGLHRSSWVWSDQNIPSIIPWMPSTPHNVLTENCVFLSNALVDDAPCSEIRPFFCYRIITGQQQIIRVKVQSDQDVNDPAVKAAILEKIQEKLKEHGLENVKVTFRERPDEVALHKIN